MRNIEPTLIELCIPPVTGHNRLTLRGIAAYLKAGSRRWQPRINAFRSHAEPPELVDRAGLIGTSAALLHHEMQGPTVQIGAGPSVHSGWPRIMANDTQVSRLIVQELLDRGHRRIVFIGEVGRPFADRRLAAIRRHLDDVADLHVIDIAQSATAEVIAGELALLKPPLGIFVQHDNKAIATLDACRLAGLRVPDDAAVISVDDDDILCSLASPPLSSVRLDSHRMGYEAARLLDRMLRGEDVPADTVIEVPPLELVVRQSSDALAVPDKEVSEAIRYIREHACDGIDVRDVLKRVAISRRGLEMAFRRLMDRTPAEEIRRVKVERAKVLLTTTNLGVLDVGLRCGFGNAAGFSVTFKKEAGTSPAGWRRQRQ
jgi:LacI family transcriptional regulator